jgi:class 3 adenylate cyclase
MTHGSIRASRRRKLSASAGAFEGDAGGQIIAGSRLSPAVSALPSGTVTFLFTDIQGSTGLLERHPEAYRGAIAQHHAILAEAITESHGLIFETGRRRRVRRVRVPSRCRRGGAPGPG